MSRFSRALHQAGLPGMTQPRKIPREDMVRLLWAGEKPAPSEDDLVQNSSVIQSPIGPVKMGKGQVEKLSLKERAHLIKYVRPTIEDPTAIIDEIDAKGRPAKVFIQRFTGTRRSVFCVVTAEIDSVRVAITEHLKDLRNAAGKAESGWVVYTRPGLSANTPEDDPTIASAADEDTNPIGDVSQGFVLSGGAGYALALHQSPFTKPLAQLSFTYSRTAPSPFPVEPGESPAKAASKRVCGTFRAVLEGVPYVFDIIPSQVNNDLFMVLKDEAGNRLGMQRVSIQYLDFIGMRSAVQAIVKQHWRLSRG